jgi:flagellar motor switch protein FliN/FliY
MDERMKDQPMTDDESRDLAPATRDAGETPELPEFQPSPAGAPGFTANEEEGMQAVYDVPVKVQAVLGRARMPIGDLLQLRIGTVVELDRRVGEPIDIFVNNRLIARGEVVLIEAALGVTLTEIVRTES